MLQVLQRIKIGWQPIGETAAPGSKNSPLISSRTCCSERKIVELPRLPDCALPRNKNRPGEVSPASPGPYVFLIFSIVENPGGRVKKTYKIVYALVSAQRPQCFRDSPPSCSGEDAVAITGGSADSPAFSPEQSVLLKGKRTGEE